MAVYFGSTKIAIGLNDTLSYTTRNQSRTVTPSISSQTLIPDPGYTGMSQVTVNAIPNSYIIPSGTLSISSNSTYNISSYASVNVDLPFYNIYKSIANKDPLYDTISSASEWANSFSYIKTAQFASQVFSGNWTFQNVRYILDKGFTWVGPKWGGFGYSCTFNFPICSYISDYAFWGRLGSYNVSLPECLSIASNVFASGSLVNITIPNCTYIDRYCFEYTTISNINLPKITSLFTRTFGNCSSLISISIPLLEVISGYSVFQYCTNIESFDFPNLTTISGAYTFASCSKLNFINFPNLTTINGGSNFIGCSSLSVINLPNLISIINGNYNFAALSLLTTISFPNLTMINGDYVFNYCSALSYINFPKVTNISGNSVFNACSNLQNINLPMLSLLSGSYIFDGCSNLSQITLPNLLSINNGSYIFSGCINLHTISLPKISIISQYYMFYLCSKLQSVYLMGSIIPSIAFGGYNIFIGTPISQSSYLGYFGSIYVPSSLLTQYQSAQYWSYYSSRFVGV